MNISSSSSEAEDNISVTSISSIKYHPQKEDIYFPDEKPLSRLIVQSSKITSQNSEQPRINNSTPKNPQSLRFDFSNIENPSLISNNSYTTQSSLKSNSSLQSPSSVKFEDSNIPKKTTQSETDFKDQNSQKYDIKEIKRAKNPFFFSTLADSTTTDSNFTADDLKTTTVNNSHSKNQHSSSSDSFMIIDSLQTNTNHDQATTSSKKSKEKC